MGDAESSTPALPWRVVILNVIERRDYSPADRSDSTHEGAIFLSLL
jgi:hypothetical protein